MNGITRLALLAAAVALAGCGGAAGPERHKLTGTVKYNGQDVPHGQILFSPDASRQNSGPGSVAIIRDGKYETYEGKGTVGGPHRVSITGYETPLDGSVPEEDVREMFPSYQTTVDLPRGAGKYDFVVPANP